MQTSCEAARGASHITKATTKIKSGGDGVAPQQLCLGCSASDRPLRAKPEGLEFEDNQKVYQKSS
jgi:hypothetical protein